MLVFTFKLANKILLSPNVKVQFTRSCDNGAIITQGNLAQSNAFRGRVACTSFLAESRGQRPRLIKLSTGTSKLSRQRAAFRLVYDKIRIFSKQNKMNSYELC